MRIDVDSVPSEDVAPSIQSDFAPTSNSVETLLYTFSTSEALDGNAHAAAMPSIGNPSDLIQRRHRCLHNNLRDAPEQLHQSWLTAVNMDSVVWHHKRLDDSFVLEANLEKLHPLNGARHASQWA
eukprot:CAMPEP_0177444190 /NCGR_PEP_ID=MMETSP0369-20130122/5863_1 /TAXON_ID=447022 ORGANISM="Scrippsiella hangoei-like, Strain SHHI-4" /NCGR_SAMPLE_ID=MMETSP0369 /ASSEMBLY_ACC=CAM_ASM_000364 /LENGTH=124 /DNA_ID=CAMNT_0018916221 /DNA_START=99 /DNA_END=474 /DNA_ORIENTATION=-